jgi:uncharacterized protein YqeY
LKGAVAQGKDKPGISNLRNMRMEIKRSKRNKRKKEKKTQSLTKVQNSFRELKRKESISKFQERKSAAAARKPLQSFLWSNFDGSFQS